MSPAHIHRFDSLTAMVEACKRRYASRQVTVQRHGPDIVLEIQLPDGGTLENLIVHFEGERTYVVRLPAPPAGTDVP